MTDFHPSSPDSIDEKELLRRCREGSLEHFEPIVRKHQKRLLGVAFNLLRDPVLAEEAVQITLIKAWQKLHSFKGDSDIGTWLFRLCVNNCYDLIRSRNRKKEDPIEGTPGTDTFHPIDYLTSSGPNPSEETFSQETHQTILSALEQLPEDLRTVIVLREMHGLDYREIASTLQCREGTVMSRLFHARRKLRQLLKHLAPQGRKDA